MSEITMKQLENIPEYDFDHIEWRHSVIEERFVQEIEIDGIHVVIDGEKHQLLNSRGDLILDNFLCIWNVYGKTYILTQPPVEWVEDEVEEGKKEGTIKFVYYEVEVD